MNRYSVKSLWVWLGLDLNYSDKSTVTNKKKIMSQILAYLKDAWMTFKLVFDLLPKFLIKRSSLYKQQYLKIFSATLATYWVFRKPSDAKTV